jgi:hypothetical protein
VRDLRLGVSHIGLGSSLVLMAALPVTLGRRTAAVTVPSSSGRDSRVSRISLPLPPAGLVCVCARARARVCVRACVRARARARVCVRACLRACARGDGGEGGGGSTDAGTSTVESEIPELSPGGMGMGIPRIRVGRRIPRGRRSSLPVARSTPQADPKPWPGDSRRAAASGSIPDPPGQGQVAGAAASDSRAGVGGGSELEL